jgi:hypothetical protein
VSGNDPNELRICARMSIKNKFTFIFFIILQSILSGTGFAQTPSSWSQVVEKLQKKVNSGGLGNDVSISFQNTPYKKYMEDELMAYTFRSDGKVIIQMNDRVANIAVPDNELLWLARFLIEHKLGEFPDKEAQLAESGSFSIIVKVGNARKGIWLYNKGNDQNRELAWQYLLHLGQTFLETAGLRDKSQPILPACEGINRFEELDNNNDGVIDWLRLKIGFYSFKSGQYTFDFSGVKHSVFLPQGKSEKDFFLNTYLLQPETVVNKEYLFFVIDSQPPCPIGPYRMDLGLNSNNYPGKKFRICPDFVFTGPESNKFTLRLHQSAILEAEKGPAESGNKLLRFTLSELTPEGARLIGKDEPVFLAKGENIHLEDFGCISSIFRLGNIDPGSASFEVGWSIPESEAIQKKIEYLQEILSKDDYSGDKESAKSSLDFCQECLELLDGQEELKINVIYTSPPEAS